MSASAVVPLDRAAESDQDGTLYLAAATIRVRRNWTDGPRGHAQERPRSRRPDDGRRRPSPRPPRQRDDDTTDRDLVFCDQLSRHLGYKTFRTRYAGCLRYSYGSSSPAPKKELPVSLQGGRSSKRGPERLAHREPLGRVCRDRRPLHATMPSRNGPDR